MTQLHLSSKNPYLQRIRCPACKSKYTHITEHIYNGQNLLCIARIECHVHSDDREAFISITFGNPDNEQPGKDRVTFCCRYGYLDGHDEPLFSLIKNPQQEPSFGKRLDREEALRHPLIDTCWEITDFIASTSKPLHDFMHHNARPGRLRLSSILSNYRPKDVLRRRKITSFWNWFSTQSAHYLHFEENQDMLFKNLRDKLEGIDANLCFEFGPLVGTRRDFLISCNGISASAQAVVDVVAAKSDLPKWNVIAFRQRHKASSLQLDGIELNKKDLRYTYNFNENNLVDIQLHIKDYKEEDGAYKSLAFLMLDTLIGEYDMMTRIGHIEFHALVDSEKAKTNPIDELVGLIDSRK